MDLAVSLREDNHSLLFRLLSVKYLGVMNIFASIQQWRSHFWHNLLKSNTFLSWMPKSTLGMVQGSSCGLLMHGCWPSPGNCASHTIIIAQAHRGLAGCRGSRIHFEPSGSFSITSHCHKIYQRDKFMHNNHIYSANYST